MTFPINCTAALLDYSLLSRQGDQQTLHGLVQAVVRDSPHDPDYPRWAGSVMRMHSAAFQAENHEPATWAQCRELLPHAWRRPTTLILGEVELVECASLLTRAATYDHSRAEFSAARPCSSGPGHLRAGAWAGPPRPPHVWANLARLLQELK